MAQEEIEFRKIRDFGENLNDTFTFIRQNLKPLLLYFFAICGAFLLGRAILAGIYQSNSFSILDQFREGYRAGRTRTLSDTFSPLYFVVLLISLLSYVAMRVSIAAYIKCYIVYGKAGVTLDRVWAVFKAYYLRIFIYSIPLILLLIVGFVFCLLPGIYLVVVFTPFDYVVVMENAGFGEAFDKCFRIIKENFWISFAIYIIAGLIYWFGSMIVGMVAGVVIGLATYFTTKSIGATAGIATSFLNIFTGVFYIIFLVSAAFQYFNLVEIYDGTGILQRIDSIGSTENQPDQTPEEY